MSTYVVYVVCVVNIAGVTIDNELHVYYDDIACVVIVVFVVFGYGCIVYGYVVAELL